MIRSSLARSLFAAAASLAIGAVSMHAAADAASGAAAPVTSKAFMGAKANAGTVTLANKGGQFVLTLSPDFVTPDTPAPHWRIVDSKGQIFLLERLKTKGESDKAHRSIVVPEYIHDIAKVQIWCAWAEVVLGETSFASVPALYPDNASSANSMHAMDAGPHTSTMFAGPKANTGNVTHTTKDGKSILTLSDAFVTPDTPAPHWRIVDSSGKTFLLQSLKTKGAADKANRTIVVPEYIPDVAKVQIWCAWAEVVLGEASFESPVR